MKRLIATLFLLAALLFCATALGEGEPKTYNLYICGVQVTDANKTDVLGDGTVSFNPEPQTPELTLNGATLSKRIGDGRTFDSISSIIDADINIKINLVGENSIRLNIEEGEDPTDAHMGVYVTRTLTIDGDGSLSIIVAGQGIVRCLNAPIITINNGTFHLTSIGIGDAQDAKSIYAHTLNLNGGTLHTTTGINLLYGANLQNVTIPQEEQLIFSGAYGNIYINANGGTIVDGTLILPNYITVTKDLLDNFTGNGYIQSNGKRYSAKTYPVTVIGGTAERATEHSGMPVTLTSIYNDAHFTGWTVSDGVTLDDASSPSTTFIMPPNPVTATSSGTEHEWNYDTTKDTEIIAHADCCSMANESISLQAPQSLTYNGSPKAFSITKAPAALQSALKDAVITYEPGGSTAPVDAGDYTVSLSAAGLSTQKAFTITPMQRYDVYAQLEYFDHDYTGAALQPNVIVRTSGGILQPEFYTVTFQDNLNAGDEAKAIIHPAAGSNYTFSPITLFFTINKIDPAYTLPTGLIATEGNTLADVVLPEADNGAWKWQDPLTTSVGTEGVRSFKLDFEPNDKGNYNTLTDLSVNITVARPLTAAIQPAKQAVRIGDNASFTVKVDGGTAPYLYTWQIDRNDGTGFQSAMPAVRPGFDLLSVEQMHSGYRFRCTVQDSNAREVTTDTVVLQILLPAESPDTPTASAITYGQTLADAALSDSDWKWTDSSIRPTVSNSGYTAYYTITNDDQYDWSDIEGYDAENHRLVRTIPVTVSKAIAPGVSSPVAGELTCDQALSNASLTDGWTWLDGSIVLSAAAPQTTAIYSITDESNYDWSQVEGYNAKAHRIERTVDVVLVHAFTNHEAQAATCTDVGWTAYDHCSRCGLTSYNELAATGHDYAFSGFTWDSSYSAAKAVFVCQNDATHTYEKEAAVSSTVTVLPTCESAGIIRHTASYTDDDGERIASTDETVPATGHDYRFSEFVWTGYTAKAKYVCGNDAAHTEEREAAVTDQITTQPTYETDGERTYTASYTDPATGIEHQDTKIEIIPAKKHNWADAWTSDDVHHWHECENADCEITDNRLKDGYGEHSYGSDTDSVCDVCGYQRTVAYAITQGALQQVEQGSEALFVSNADFAKFIEVQIDGSAVSPSHYTAVSGSTRVTLKSEYTKTLAVGEHILTILSSDGKAETTFIVKAAVLPLTIVPPADQLVIEGQKAAFSVSVSGGTAPYSYQWYIDRGDGAGWKKLDGATDASCTLSSTKLSDDGSRFYCAVSSADGQKADSHAAALTVRKYVPVPQTGDHSAPLLWLGSSLLAMMGIVLLCLRGRRKAC